MLPGYVISLPCCYGGCGHLCAAEVVNVRNEHGEIWFRLVPLSDKCRWFPFIDCQTKDLAVQTWYGFIEKCRKPQPVQLPLF